MLLPRTVVVNFGVLCKCLQHCMQVDYWANLYEQLCRNLENCLKLSYCIVDECRTNIQKTFQHIIEKEIPSLHIHIKIVHPLCPSTGPVPPVRLVSVHPDHFLGQKYANEALLLTHKVVHHVFPLQR